MPVHVHPVAILPGAGGDPGPGLRHRHRHVESGLHPVRAVHRAAAAAGRGRERPVRVHRRAAGHAAEKCGRRWEALEALHQLEGSAPLLRGGHHGRRLDHAGRRHLAPRQAARAARLAPPQGGAEELRRPVLRRLHPLLPRVELGGAHQAGRGAAPSVGAAARLAAAAASRRGAPHQPLVAHQQLLLVLGRDARLLVGALARLLLHVPLLQAAADLLHHVGTGAGQRRPRDRVAAAPTAPAVVTAPIIVSAPAIVTAPAVGGLVAPVSVSAATATGAAVFLAGDTVAPIRLPSSALAPLSLLQVCEILNFLTTYSRRLLSSLHIILYHDYILLYECVFNEYYRL